MVSDAPFLKLCKPKDALGSDDSYLLHNVLSIEPTIFKDIFKEVNWGKLKLVRGGIVPREISIQGSFAEKDGQEIEPVYRLLVVQQPETISWTPSVLNLKNQIEKLVGQELNHGLVQLYRDSQHYIKDHSDKTLDILKGSSIMIYSLGASRTMLLTHKKTGVVQSLDLTHNSLLILGWKTNREWWHGIRKDERPDCEKRPDEMAYGGSRISITLRSIATFRDRKIGKLSGQGARNQLCGDDGDDEQKQQMDVKMAFGLENQLGAKFDWDKYYGRGFNILRFTDEEQQAP